MGLRGPYEYLRGPYAFKRTVRVSERTVRVSERTVRVFERTGRISVFVQLSMSICIWLSVDVHLAMSTCLSLPAYVHLIGGWWFRVVYTMFYNSHAPCIEMRGMKDNFTFFIKFFFYCLLSPFLWKYW